MKEWVDGFKSPKSQGILVKIGILQSLSDGVEFECDNVKYIELKKKL